VPVREFVTSPYLKFQLVRNVSASIGLSPAKASKDPSMYPTKEKSASTTQPCCDESMGNKVYSEHVSILEVHQQLVPRIDQ
jgi:hypothetical protein